MARCLVVAILMSVVVNTARADEGPAFVRAVEGITELKLANGMQVLLFPDVSRPNVTVNLTLFVGSRHEGYGEAGMAHLLEHMVFKGTPSRPAIPAELTKRGAQFNGTTWLDRTNYYETLSASDENLEFAISMEADRMINSLIKAEDLASEMTVVRNEFERGENNPQRVLMQRVFSTAYEWHNYGKSTIGNRADIERVPVENLRRFYKRFYQPDNAMLIVAGKFDPKKAVALIQQYFGAIPKPERELDRTYTEEPAQDGDRMVIVRRVGEVAVAALAYHIPAGGHPDFATIDVMTTIMGSEPSGRLYDSLVKRRLAAGVFGSSFALHDPGIIMFGAQAAPGTDGTTMLQNLIDTVEGSVQKPFTAEEVDRARSEMLRQREIQVTDSQGLAIQLSDWAAQGDWRLFFIYRDQLEKVTAEEVNRVAAAYLVRSNRTAGLFEPTKEAERATVPPTPNLAETIGDYAGRSDVVQGEEFDASPEGIESRLERSQLSSGIKVTLLPRKTRGSSVTLKLNLRYANLNDLKGLAVAAKLLPGLLDRGTENLTRQQISDELNNYRAEMNVSGDAGNLSVTVQTNRENLIPVLRIIEEVFRRPKLPAEELELIREEMLSNAAERVNDPVAIAMNAVTRKMAPYEVDDPRYIAELKEDMERTRAVTIEQIQDVYQRLVGSTVGELTIIGDFDKDLVVPAVDEFTKGWTSKVVFERIPRISVNNLTGNFVQINTPDKANAAYFAAMTLPMKDSHPDYPALAIGNFILGSGGLSSRLADRVRQKDGLSYTVQSNLQASAVDERTAFYVFAISNPANSAKLHEAIQEELKRLVADGITQEELDRAKEGYLQSQQVSRTDENSLIPMLEAYAFIGRDMKYVAEFESKVRNLTVEDVNKALKKHLKPERLFIVSAGDFESLPAK
ncbi:MAG: pitrilysin family protein [Planctomycetaceae bacterium]